MATLLSNSSASHHGLVLLKWLGDQKSSYARAVGIIGDVEGRRNDWVILPTSVCRESKHQAHGISATASGFFNGAYGIVAADSRFCNQAGENGLMFCKQTQSVNMDINEIFMVTPWYAYLCNFAAQLSRRSDHWQDPVRSASMQLLWFTDRNEAVCERSEESQDAHFEGIRVDFSHLCAVQTPRFRLVPAGLLGNTTQNNHRIKNMTGDV
ncbi:hypothetical protein BKA93DRAFT_751841 [Sparassis latifolia]